MSERMMREEEMNWVLSQVDESGKDRKSSLRQKPKRANPRIAAAILFLGCALSFGASVVAGQGLDPEALLRPPTDTWPTYNGDYSGRRYSTLDQINAGNVGSLTLAWMFQTRGAAIKSTPLVVNNILYFTVPDNVWAVDAKFGRQIWHYERKSEGGHIGHRGLAMYKNWLYFETPDAHLICLDAKDGKVRWDIELADAKLGYFATMAPLVIRDHVIAGVSGDSTDIRGILTSVDPETGSVQWHWYTEPDPGQPGSETWPKDGDALLHGGGMTWMTGTYDPALNLLYWGTGNPNPVLVGDSRPGDNLYTCSIVALNPDTGKLAWAFQPSPHDVHDWDAVQTPILFDADFKGKPRKLLAQASRNGFFFVLDRRNGEHLLTSAFIDQTWASGVDSRGRPIGKPEANPSPDGALVELALDTIARRNPSVADQMPASNATLALLTPRPLSAMAEAEAFGALAGPGDANLLAAAQTHLPARMKALAAYPPYRLELTRDRAPSGWVRVEWRAPEEKK